MAERELLGKRRTTSSPIPRWNDQSSGIAAAADDDDEGCDPEFDDDDEGKRELRLVKNERDIELPEGLGLLVMLLLLLLLSGSRFSYNRFGLR